MLYMWATFKPWAAITGTNAALYRQHWHTRIPWYVFGAAAGLWLFVHSWSTSVEETAISYWRDCIVSDTKTALLTIECFSYLFGV